MSSAPEGASVVIDLDGVVWLAGEALPGVDVAVRLLRESDHRVIFATNNSSPTLDTLLKRLDAVGIQAEPDDLVTAAQAAASAVSIGATAMIIGEAGLHEATAVREISEGPAATAVIVGWHRDFTFDLIASAAQAIRQGAAFIATNDDPTHPTPSGLLPGTGALVAAIATAAERAPLIAGKPGEAMVALIESRANDVSLVIGDRPSTDGALATRLGVPFGLVGSEATPAAAAHVELAGERLIDIVSAWLS